MLLTLLPFAKVQNKQKKKKLVNFFLPFTASSLSGLFFICKLYCFLCSFLATFVVRALKLKRYCLADVSHFISCEICDMNLGKESLLYRKMYHKIAFIQREYVEKVGIEALRRRAYEMGGKFLKFVFLIWRRQDVSVWSSCRILFLPLTL